ncbi:hypothetical protein NQ314_010901 [Rhamnusium bicolor]|uniref:UDP-glucuronosyltransferase n=1 Tax=Rhamnusium bicolor TaxID=1586634 RepID=A0AAV8XNM4_9CUCU|nr:hypothetical protein NQ314_010901 [Rhamnusium bicolor]
MGDNEDFKIEEIFWDLNPLIAMKDLQIIMDNAKDGVILFSLGSNIRSDKLQNQTKQTLVNAFSKLKQTVLWKFESNFENIPTNVIIRKWLPQNDILGHPNLRLFISHGGALGTLESAYHGVPIIGMPFFMDQQTTISSMVERKLALKVDLRNITSQDFLENIHEILKKSDVSDETFLGTYSKNMKEISKRMRDQPQSPLDTAIFWIEYAMRYNGTHFLNPKSRDISLFVSSSTDVILFLISVALSFIYLFFQISRKIKGIIISKLKKKEKIH